MSIAGSSAVSSLLRRLEPALLVADRDEPILIEVVVLRDAAAIRLVARAGQILDVRGGFGAASGRNERIRK